MRKYQIMFRYFFFCMFCVSHHVCAQVNAEDGDGAQRQWNVDDDEEQEGSDLGDVAGQSVGNGFLQVIEDQATWRESEVYYLFI